MARNLLLLGMFSEQVLNPVPSIRIDDRGVKAVVHSTFVCQLPDVDWVRQDLIEMAAADEPAAGGLSRPVRNRSHPPGPATFKPRGYSGGGDGGDRGRG